ncbi:unnamed protein product [Schistosoma curassoni]|nr:unnamed protein product [Schistosoma curassoni]
MLPNSLDQLSERTQIHGTNTITNHNSNNNNNNTNQFSDFRLGIIQLLNHSTIHGLSHLSKATNHINRFIWFILWLIGMIGFLINLSYIIEHYLSYPILTSYINDYEAFQWPDIILCNAMAPYNVYDKQYNILWNKYMNLARNLSLHIPNDLFLNIDDIDTNEIIIQSLIHSTISYWEFNIGNIDNMFQFIAMDNGYQGIRLSVGLDDNLVMIPIPLNQYFYTQILQKRYNVPCFNFQISRHLNKTNYHHIEKLAFGIKFNYQSYLIINSSYTSHMIDLYITLPNHFPNMNSIELIPGYINHIKLEMLRIKRIKHHYSHHHHHHHHEHHHEHQHQHQSLCNENKFSTIIYDGDLINKRLIYGSNELCHRILSQYLYLNECHCYSPFLPYGYYGNIPIINNNHNKTMEYHHPALCLNMSLYNKNQLIDNVNCMYRVYQKYNNLSLYMNLIEAKQCDLLHHLPYCDHVYYQNFGIHRIIMNELWSNTYNDARATFLIRTFRDVFINNTTTNYNTTYNNTTDNTTYNNEKLTTQQILLEMRNNFGLLIIERNRPQGKLVREEQEYSLAQLLSDIGGNMGLWIGISVIGLFEFIELISFILYTLCNYIIHLCRKN